MKALTLQQVHDLIYDAFENHLGSEGLTDVCLSCCEGSIRLDAEDGIIVVTCHYESPKPRE